MFFYFTSSSYLEFEHYLLYTNKGCHSSAVDILAQINKIAGLNLFQGMELCAYKCLITNSPLHEKGLHGCQKFNYVYVLSTQCQVPSLIFECERKDQDHIVCIYPGVYLLGWYVLLLVFDADKIFENSKLHKNVKNHIQVSTKPRKSVGNLTQRKKIHVYWLMYLEFREACLTPSYSWQEVNKSPTCINIKTSDLQ